VTERELTTAAEHVLNHGYGGQKQGKGRMYLPRHTTIRVRCYVPHPEGWAWTWRKWHRNISLYSLKRVLISVHWRQYNLKSLAGNMEIMKSFERVIRSKLQHIIQKNGHPTRLTRKYSMQIINTIIKLNYVIVFMLEWSQKQSIGQLQTQHKK
jgi:hypothetical protein